MIRQDVLDKLSEVSYVEWEKTTKKCYQHGKLKLSGKTKTGAHTEQRLEMNPIDYYFSNACAKLCLGDRDWDYNKVPLEEHIMSIMDSLMNNEVKKYKVEREHNKTTVSIDIEQLNLFDTLKDDDSSEDVEELEKLKMALNKACEENKQYALFVDLTKQGLNYDAICEKMNCSIKEAYRIKENIVRRAKKILKSQ